MPRHKGLCQWISTVSTYLSPLSQPQATVLALWSLGIVLARSCAQTAVVSALAPFVGSPFANLRQRLREWLWDADDKCGQKRQQIEVSKCFPFLMRWVLHHWKGSSMMLAMDATTLADRFTVLAISVLYCGLAIPVAWSVLPGNTKRRWKPHWKRLMNSVKEGLPSTVFVIVLADRGLSGIWLFRQIRRRKWHPPLRIKRTGSFRPHGLAQWRPVASFAPQPGVDWRGVGYAFKKCGMKATLLAYWEQGAKEAWILLTDLSPETVDPTWYGYRSWIEQGFRLFKRGGWQWQRTRMTDTHRVERLWLAMAVATLWSANVGGGGETLNVPQPFLVAPTDADSTRRIHVCRIGSHAILFSLCSQRLLGLSSFIFDLPQPRLLTSHSP